MTSSAAADVFADDADVMQHALRVARKGIGFVEPNPAVGAVIVDDSRRLIAEGFHQRFGEAHAEVNAINAAQERTRGAQLFVTLEPCSHHGKTPPCVDAVITAGFRRVVIGCADPAPHVAGQGIAELRAAGIEVLVGVCHAEAEWLIAPFHKLMIAGLPWVHAKWAMTLDGRIATKTGHSKWISGEASRAVVHRLRGRMDAIITGAGTIRADDPLLTARPPGFRTALRVVVDSDGRCVEVPGQLMSTIDEAGVLICVRGERADSGHLKQLTDLGAETFVTTGADGNDQVLQLLRELGQRGLTNVLLEAGAGLLGTFFDLQLVDEIHAFVAPKIIGGSGSVSPIGGSGLAEIPSMASLTGITVRQFGDDVLIEGRCRK